MSYSGKSRVGNYLAPPVSKKWKWLTFILVCLMTSFTAMAQTSVTGTVTDQAGEPLIGASVMVPGTTVGTSTDVDGKFKINVAQGKKLRVSYVGYVTKEVVV
ncbi:carboxypeptidase-like regulatory domain-containing protein, partial [uncultured Duncaniella sp.]|uniref:carboxypeptidase-like regulatory domain-containing protein n=1 Tax=uncultured Duncaniella sp. TaxID=2768039 RepID=UPI00262F6132